MVFAYEKSKIGKRIAVGGDRKVYRYGDTQVIKISSLSLLLGNKLRKKLRHDYEVCRRYLPEFVVTTMDITPEGTKRYIEIQEYVQGEMLRKEHLLNREVRLQFQQLLAGMRRMKEDEYAEMDLIGNRGVFERQFSNVLLDKEDRLRVIDTTLYESKSLGVLGFIFYIVIIVATLRQKYLIKRFLS